MSQRILIVDDNAPNRKALGATLQASGYDVSEASDGAAALELLSAGRFDAVITDVLMPRMDGFQLCHEIRNDERLRRIPIIVYTATYIAAEDEKLSHDLGADRFLRKPATNDAILQTVRDVLGAGACRQPKAGAGLDEFDTLQQYSQRLVNKLEQRSLYLEQQSLALSFSELRLRSVFDAVNDALFLILLDEGKRLGRFVDVNEVACQMFGYAREEFLTRSVQDLDPLEEAFFSALGSRLHAGERLVIERTLVTKSGQPIPTEISVRSFSLQGQTLAIAVVRDIAERKRAEEVRRESERRLRDILDNVVAFVGLLSTDGWLLEINRAPLAAASLGRDDVIGKPFHECYWWSYSAEVQAQLQRAIRQAAAGENTRYDVAVRLGSDRQMIIDFALSPLRDAAGRIVQIVGSAVDITERKELERQYLRAQRMEAIGTLASGVAHDLNNILSPMLMAAGLLRDKLPADHDREIVSLIETGTRRGADIIRQLLTFSRGIEGARVSVQPRHLIKEMLTLMRETFPRNIRLEHDVAGDLWTIMANATQIHQVLLNLCVNARDAMPTGGTLTLEAQNVTLSPDMAKLNPQAKPGNYVVLSVGDTGTGIPPDVINRIFDPFFTTKEVGKGTGLGLSSVLGIVRGHGGFVTVESEPGRGSTFRVHLPATGTLAGDGGDAAEDGPAGRGEMVLLVDDEAPIRAATQRTLEKYGYRVVTASNGADAVPLFVQHRDAIRVVVTDAMMPMMSGVEMIRALRVIEPHIRVVAATGLDHENRRAELAALGVTEILSKPYETSALLNALRRVLDRPLAAR